jgi:hypothetical protein
MKYGITVHRNENELRTCLEFQIQYTANTKQTGAAAEYNRSFTSSQNYSSFIEKTQLPGLCG